MPVRGGFRRWAKAGVLVLGICLGAETAAFANACVWNASTSPSSWSVAGNWTSCGATTPQAADTVTFGNTKVGNCTVDVSVSVTSIDISTYTGTITQSTGSSITTSGSLSQGAGAFTGSNSGADSITVGTTFALSGGTFTSARGLLEIRGAFNETGGTFTHNSGTVFLTSTTSQNFTTNGAAFYNLTINDGLVGYWKLDENTGTAISDSSGFGNHGTLFNGPTWVTGASRPALNFDDTSAVNLAGGDDYASLGTTGLPSINGNMTIAFWMYYASIPSGQQDAVVLKSAATGIIQIGFQSNTIQAFKSGATALVTASSTPSSGWHHIAYTFDGTNHILYVDGGSPATATTAADTGATASAWLGNYTSSGGSPFTGYLDDVRVYKRVLTATEVSGLAVGNQAGTSSATQTMSGSPSFAGDLVIASGKLAAGTNTVTVGGSWLNYGGLYTTGTTGSVIFNGTGSSNKILPGGSMFQDVSVTGSGTWTLASPMDIDRARSLTTTAGVFNLSSYTLRAGAINRNGTHTIAPSTGTVVLDTNSTSMTLDAGTFTNLKIEPVGATNLVGYWKFDAGQGTTARDFSSGAHDATLSGAGWTISNVAPAVSFYNPAAVSLNGTSHYIDVGGTANASNAAYSACAWVKLNATAGFQALVTVDGTTSSGYTLIKRGDTNTFALMMAVSDTTNPALNIAAGATTVVASTWYHVCGTYDTATIRVYVNGTLEGTGSNASPWNATGHSIIGAGKWNGSRSDYLGGTVDDVRIYNIALTAAQVAALASGTYPTGLAGTPTYTLGNDTTVGGTFALDNGTFATAGYLMNNSGSGVAKVSAGTYSVGSVTNTFAGGLTVKKYGTLDLSTANGTVAIGTSGQTQVLTVDGTLSASSTTATIQKVTGANNYTFTVGSSAAATPTLNISGLKVRDTDVNGMYINTVVGSSTTFTAFNNVAFSSGSATVGATLLRIYAGTLALYGNGLTFDASTTTNLKLAGDGTGTGETRTYFGATCTNSPCESYDADDDSEPDGTGDTANGTGDEAVAQWLYRSYADTAGSIEGFPTTAFNWNTFAYWNTYVVYRDANGSTDRLYARDTDGVAEYSWDLPASVGDIVGTPRWTMEGSTHYVYVVTTFGYVYKLTDSGAAFAIVTAQAWPYRNVTGGASATATAALSMDAANVYWTGNDGSGSKKIFSLTFAMVPNGTLALVADVVAAPALAAVSGTNYLFTGTNGKIYRTATDLTSPINSTVPTSTVYGRLTVLNGTVYFPEDIGTVWALSSSTLASNWSYQDTVTSAGRHPGGCAAASQCTVRNLYVDPTTNRTYFGDKDGHLYVLSSAGALVSGYPFRPGLSTDEFQTAPLFRAGLIVIGSVSGKVFIVDESAGSTYKTFNFQSAISTISYDIDGQYLIGTASGKLYYLASVTDPT